jgi:hypothetical protein
MYEIQQGRVDSVEYYPPKRYEHLYCGEPGVLRMQYRYAATKRRPLSDDQQAGEE